MACLCAAVCAGCASDVDGPRPRETVFQKYAYDEVKRRLPYVQPGMSKIDVLTTMGSPASQTDALWQYQPLRPPALLPVEVLELRFQGNIYTGHRFATKIPGL